VTVLVADDDPDIIRFVEVNLRLEGYQVAVARNGEQALDKALTLQPDLVLLDVRMPGIDGFEVCARLRADPRGAAIPVILLTANIPVTGDHQRAHEVDADDFVVKPFDPGNLMARVRALVQAGRRR
jgi:DNA-binding response OmpR family regulator